ncbi:MAG TPA: hypothetical protein VF582_09735 [Allosphingosinicella sp.]|jgi:hypothetical protein
MVSKVLVVAAGVVALGWIGAAAAQSLPIEWTISPSGSANGANAVQLALSYRTEGKGRSTHSGPHPLSELQGLTAEQIASLEGSPARFRIVREAGALDCNGIVRRARGTGECSFLADAGFAAALQRRGLGRPSLSQHYQLMLQNVGTPLLEELERQGYRRPDLDGLVSAGIHGVSASYVRSMADAGYRLGNVEDLVSFRIHGVDADYVREMAALDPPGGRFSADQLVGMRIHGLTGAKARQYAQLGYRKLGHEDWISMSIHGVSPSFISELADAGYRGLSAQQLVSMRIHGVTPDYVRQVRAAGYTLPDAEQLVRMRISGVRPGRR